MKSKLNKTIDFSLQEADEFLKSAIKESQLEGLDINKLEDNIVIGDYFNSIKHFPDKYFDLIIVDPPYNLRKDYHGNIFNAKKTEEYEHFTRSWLESIHSKLKENGSIYVCCDWKSSMIIGPILSEFFNIRNRITWEREKGRGSKSNWKNSMEDIWFATKSDDYKFNVDKVKIKRRVIAPYKEEGNPKDWKSTKSGNYRLTHPSNFWSDITVPFWSMKENTAHPTQKPEKLIAKLILASSNQGDLVLDPFMGSGTTAVVCKKLDRKFIGIEQNPQYVAWSYKRLQMAEKDKEIQGYEDGVFLHRNIGL